MSYSIIRLILLLSIICLSGAAITAQDESSVLPITADTSYTVRPSDTLDTIGALFDVSPTCLAEMNEISRPRDLQIGQTLLLSVSCPRYGEDARDLALLTVQVPREVVTFVDECEGYRVQRNDSIDLIGFNLDVSMQSIAIANDLEAPYVLEINQCLVIPDDAPPWGTYPAITTASGDAGSGGGQLPGELYVMQPRDTLDVVAQQFNVSVVSLHLANSISDARLLQPGTAILIPDGAPAYGTYPAVENPLKGLLYTVQEGETADSVAQSFNVALSALLAANSLSENEPLETGTALFIPADVPAYGDDAAFDAAMLGQGGGLAGEIHVVQPRETLDVLGAIYNVDALCLAEANGIEYPRLMQPGTVLVIDTSCPAYSGYALPPAS